MPDQSQRETSAENPAEAFMTCDDLVDNHRVVVKTLVHRIEILNSRLM